MFSAFIIAFSMYSKIPMPKVEWTEDKMKYAVCYFPLIGVVIGSIVCGMFALGDYLSFGSMLKTIVLVIIPVLVTGGIHLDGFLDTVDARSSYKEREEKLEILKDPHTGAFAIIGCMVYFLLSIAVWSEVTKTIIWIAAIGFVASRALSGYALVSFQGARKKGLLASFSTTANKKVVQVTMIFYLVICTIAMIAIHPMIGSLCVIAGMLTFFYYRYFSYKEFGGVTGDLAGYFLQIFELVIVIVAVLAEKIITII